MYSRYSCPITCSYSTWRCWISLGICWFGVISPDRFEYQHTDSRLTGIEVMAPERIDQFSHRRYVSLSLLSFHLSCIEAVWGFLVSWPFSWWVLYPLLPVAWWLLSTITEHQSWIELWYWSVGFMKCFPGVNLVLYILDLSHRPPLWFHLLLFWLIYLAFRAFIRRVSFYRN